LQILSSAESKINNGGRSGAIAAPIFFPVIAAKRYKKTFWVVKGKAGLVIVSLLLQFMIAGNRDREDLGGLESLESLDGLVVSSIAAIMYDPQFNDHLQEAPNNRTIKPSTVIQIMATLCHYFSRFFPIFITA
jgi:hypothetical protein